MSLVRLSFILLFCAISASAMLTAQSGQDSQTIRFQGHINNGDGSTQKGRAFIFPTGNEDDNTEYKEVDITIADSRGGHIHFFGVWAKRNRGFPVQWTLDGGDDLIGVFDPFTMTLELYYEDGCGPADFRGGAIRP